MTRLTDRPDLVHDRHGPTSGEAPAATASETAALTSHDHDPHLAHHFDSPQQQLEAAKFGMWLFIATEFLLFGGLFVAYAVYRGNHPEMFQYGAQYLSTTMGAINTIVLILSSMTIAFAVRCAQLNQRRGLVTMLALTLLGGAIFMGIKYVEYADKLEKNLVWGIAFYEQIETAPVLEPDGFVVAATEEPDKTGDPEVGRTLWMQTCLVCHGQHGRGVRGQAPGFHESTFVAEQSDDELLAFIKRGRMPFDAASRTGVQMPPRGGNPLLKDEQIRNIIAYMRTLDLEAAPVADAVDPDADAPLDQNDEAIAAHSAGDTTEFFILRSSIPLAGDGPSGLADDWESRAMRQNQLKEKREFVDPRDDPNRPANLHLFFGIYFLMTGLHGLHVMVGMAIISALIVLSWRGSFGSAYYTPVELTGLYWHVVDVIWIFLFPLLYLIH